jgi:histidine triad (HIT) family protein
MIGLLIAKLNFKRSAMSDKCLFCGIANGDMPAKIVYQDEKCLAFHDVNPQAPVHILIVPREHIESLNEASRADDQLLGSLLRIGAKVANQLKVAEDGYRVVINTGKNANQTVLHVHVHVIGGRNLNWPPG